MNDLVKNLLLWVVVAIVLMMVFQSFSPNTAGPQEVQYSQFMEDVRNNRIRRVDIAEDERTVTFERTDGARGTVIAPRRDERMIDDLINHDVEDRKSTRLNSSHVAISYAVFCLKKKRTWVQSTAMNLDCIMLA